MKPLTLLPQFLIGAIATMAASLVIAQNISVPAAGCSPPPEAACSREQGCDFSLREGTRALGNAVDSATGREYFLDYPCDLQPGEKVNFILSLHGAGSIGSWHRHYFPAVDYKDEYRLVIATPSASIPDNLRMWTEVDDQHVQNVVNTVIEQFGKENIRSFWLAGHSQGGMTSNRLVCSDFYKDKVDGWLSLSGGRMGPIQIPSDFFGDTPPANLDAVFQGTGAGPGRASVPDCDFSYIFTSGSLEMVSLPDASPWAEKYRCDARVPVKDIVDTEKGYVQTGEQGRAPSWGTTARPGTTNVYIYPNCAGGKVVADVIRLDKGHTEGLEPKVTEYLIDMMVKAPAGKLNR